jgi:preprotein translocase subunit SecE
MKQFLVEVVSELKKTTWPGRREVYGTTLVVIVTVVICAMYLWVVDMVLSRAMNYVFKVFGVPTRWEWRRRSRRS